jgi:hypothetical protein
MRRRRQGERDSLLYRRLGHGSCPRPEAFHPMPNRADCSHHNFGGHCFRTLVVVRFYWLWFFSSAGAITIASAGAYLATHLHYHPERKRFYLAAWKMTFNDTELNPDFQYAKHALSIDEDRADFKRVPWSNAGGDYAQPAAGKEIRFEQIWFSGNHADIGGGYIKNESRLSDITLDWMVRAARNVLYGIEVDQTVLRPYPAADGPQHDECKSGIGGDPRLRWQQGYRTVPEGAILHHTVLERFALAEVLNYDTRGPYRPPALKEHQQVRHY